MLIFFGSAVFFNVIMLPQLSDAPCAQAETDGQHCNGNSLMTEQVRQSDPANIGGIV